MSGRESSQRREIFIVEVVIVAEIIAQSLLFDDHVVPVENIAQRARVGLDPGFNLVCLSPKIRCRLVLDPSCCSSFFGIMHCAYSTYRYVGRISKRA